MKMRNLLLGALLAASSLGISAALQAAVNVEVEVGPPPARVEVVPEPRPGYVWGPGYWRWEHERHVWAEGRWIRARHGHHWVPEHWAQRGHRWVFVPGHWVHD